MKRSKFSEEPIVYASAKPTAAPDRGSLPTARRQRRHGLCLSLPLPLDKPLLFCKTQFSNLPYRVICPHSKGDTYE